MISINSEATSYPVGVNGTSTVARQERHVKKEFRWRCVAARNRFPWPFPNDNNVPVQFCVFSILWLGGVDSYRMVCQGEDPVQQADLIGGPRYGMTWGPQMKPLGNGE
jgi:hypothetical protein